MFSSVKCNLATYLSPFLLTKPEMKSVDFLVIRLSICESVSFLPDTVRHKTNPQPPVQFSAFSPKLKGDEQPGQDKLTLGFSSQLQAYPCCLEK